MRTEFSTQQKTLRRIREANDILRKCVHCGFCLSACPTYALLGDERDSPRGRIYLIKEMLERDQAPAAQTVFHLDRCLSCLSCQTTCPSGVDYQQLIDDGRAYIHEKLNRSWADRLMRAFLAWIMPRPGLFRLGLAVSRLALPVAPLLGRRLRHMLFAGTDHAPATSTFAEQRVYPAQGERRMRVAVLKGCVQKVLRPSINDAAIRLLTRHGCEVVVPEDAGCCGALDHHLGRTQESRKWAAANMVAWMKEVEGEGLDGIISNATGCGAHVKRYGLDIAEAHPQAGQVAELARDVSEVMTRLSLMPVTLESPPDLIYHAPCSLRHGQVMEGAPEALLAEAGFGLTLLPTDSPCCGSSGSYSLLQPDLSQALRDGLCAQINEMEGAALATGNIGCLMQISEGTDLPVVHWVELLDWATGGPRPEGL